MPAFDYEVTPPPWVTEPDQLVFSADDVLSRKRSDKAQRQAWEDLLDYGLARFFSATGDRDYLEFSYGTLMTAARLMSLETADTFLLENTAVYPAQVDTTELLDFITTQRSEILTVLARKRSNHEARRWTRDNFGWMTNPEWVGGVCAYGVLAGTAEFTPVDLEAALRTHGR